MLENKGTMIKVVDVYVSKLNETSMDIMTNIRNTIEIFVFVNIID